MKFGKFFSENSVKEWSFYYLSYNSLKKQIGKGTTPDEVREGEREFMDSLDKELEKINSFYSLKGQEGMEKLKNILNRIKKGDATIEVEKLLEEINTLYLNLHKFQQLNLLGFKKLLKKHDKHTKIGARTWFMIRLEDQPFVVNDFDTLLLELSSTWKLLHKTRGKADPSYREEDENAENASSFNFVRKTTKYWVPEDSAVEVKLAILKHLPISTFTPRSDSLITSVYYDTKDLEFYHQRLVKEEGSINVRMRTYGKGPYRYVYVERKTHHESWVGEASIKQRFAVKEKHLYDFLHGTYTLDEDLRKAVQRKEMKQKEADEALTLSRELQETAVAKKLIPTVTTRYTRTAFQLPKSNAVRISLDCQLHMILEQNVAFQGGRWGRNLESEVSLKPNEICWFPFAVLETKFNLQMVMSEPAWVKDLVGSGKLIECGKFSKYMHGCVALLPDSCRMLPSWLSLLESCTPQNVVQFAKERQEEYNEQKKLEFLAKEGEKGKEEIPISLPTTAPSFPASPKVAKKDIELSSISNYQSPGEHERLLQTDVDNISFSRPFWQRMKDYFFPEKKPIATPLRVEPKTFFANERTLIQWLSFLVLILSTGMILVRISPNWQGFRIVGLAFTIIALTFMLYALSVYHRRRRAIRERKKGPYDDPYGPGILVALLMVTLGVVIYATSVMNPCKGERILVNSFFTRPISGIVYDPQTQNLLGVGRNLVTWVNPSKKTLNSKIIVGNFAGVGIPSSNSNYFYLARSSPPGLLEV